MEWRNVSENYECSNEGHIRNKKTKHVLKEFDSCRDGYLRTQFDGKTQTIHRVIAKAFLPQDETKSYVNHIDGNKKNNNVSNLEWCTFSENIKHAYDNNLIIKRKGEYNGRHILTLDDVIHIRKIYKAGDINNGAKPLSKKYGVAPQTISAVVSGQNWKYIDNK